MTAPRARRGISVLEESFTGMVSEPLIFYCSYFLLCWSMDIIWCSDIDSGCPISFCWSLVSYKLVTVLLFFFKLNKEDSSLFLVLESHDYVLLLSSLKSFHLHFKHINNPWNGTWLEGFGLFCFVNCILIPLSVSGNMFGFEVKGETQNFLGTKRWHLASVMLLAIVWMKFQNMKQWATNGGNWKLPDCWVIPGCVPCHPNYCQGASTHS